MEPQQCDNCRFYQDRNDGTDTGVCRRHTPVGRLADIHYRFPETTPADWCGEYEQNVQPPATPTADNAAAMPTSDANRPTVAAMSVERAWLEMGVISGKMLISHRGGTSGTLEVNIRAVSDLEAMRPKVLHLPHIHRALGEIANKLARSHGGDDTERLAASNVAANELYELSLQPNIHDTDPADQYGEYERAMPPAEPTADNPVRQLTDKALYERIRRTEPNYLPRTTRTRELGGPTSHIRPDIAAGN